MDTTRGFGGLPIRRDVMTTRGISRRERGGLRAPSDERHINEIRVVGRLLLIREQVIVPDSTTATDRGLRGLPMLSSHHGHSRDLTQRARRAEGAERSRHIRWDSDSREVVAHSRAGDRPGLDDGHRPRASGLPMLSSHHGHSRDLTQRARRAESAEQITQKAIRSRYQPGCFPVGMGDLRPSSPRLAIGCPVGRIRRAGDTKTS
jgi:hypothetical protein